MKKSNYTLAVLTLLVAMLTAHAAFGQATPPPTNSVKSSPNSGTDANKAIRACMATAVELEKTRTLVDALETEKRVITERLATERQANALLTELAAARKSENDTLRTAIEAKNETIAAKDGVIAAQERLNASLKAKRPSLLRRIGDVLAGAAAVAIFK
jgi:chromosome segregation ATPase